MAAGNFTFYSAGKLAILNGSVDLDTDTIVMALLTSSYTPSADHSTWADLSDNEVADADYTQTALGSVTLTQSGGTVTYDCADVSFGSDVSITAKYAALVKGTAGSLTGTDVLIGYVDLDTGGGSVSSTNSVFSVNTPSGIFTAT